MIVRTESSVPIPLPPALVEDQGLSQRWQAVPFHVEPRQAQSASRALSLIRSPEISKPSIVAQLPLELANHNLTVRMVDDLFVEALRDYRRTLTLATASDLGLSLIPRNPSGDFAIAMAKGAARLALRTPDIPVIKHIVGPLLILIGGIWGVITQSSITEETISEERSVNRGRWVREVIIKEELRLTRSMRVIEQRVRRIQRDIEEVDPDLVDVDQVAELRMLDDLTSYLAPADPLRINQLSVQEYLIGRGIVVLNNGAASSSQE